MFYLTATALQGPDGEPPGTDLEIVTDEIVVVPGQNTVILQHRRAGTVPWTSVQPDLVPHAGGTWAMRLVLPWPADVETEMRVMVTPPQGQSSLTRAISVKLA